MVRNRESRPSSRQDAGSASDSESRRVAPGKVTRTSSVVPARGNPVQGMVAGAGAPQPEVKTAWEWTNDPWMDAAHRGTLPPGHGGVAPVQAKHEGSSDHATHTHDHAAGGAEKDASHRLAGDNALDDIFAGSRELENYTEGRDVVKLQQALVDMGYPLPLFGVDGKLGDETEGALKRFQTDHGVPDSGKLDKATIEAMDRRFDTRADYVRAATEFDTTKPRAGTRALSSDDKKDVHEALVPQRGGGGSAAKFEKDKGGKSYGAEMRKRLTALIGSFHKQLFADKEPLRADEKTNFHEWSTLEGPANAAKGVTDLTYGALNKGPKFEAGVNLIDQWTDEEDINKNLSDPQKREKAKRKVWYFINSNCTKVNELFNAVPTDSEETSILTPIVEELTDTDKEVQTLLEIDMGWEGAQLEGTVYLQRYKSADADKNRTQMWELFQVCIHEYIHTLADGDYKAYAESLNDSTRYNTLIEGFCDFFTENVRTTVNVDKPLRKKVEGPYYDENETAPSVSVGVYPSIREAERVVAIVGINNAQLAYFRGETELIGA